jgi:branched-chain amino acid transport system ATP-binding protein
MERPLFSVRNLVKRYGGVLAVNDVSFDVEAGSITGLIGPNGSGKSTTIDCISGVQKANGGQWSLDGRQLEGLPPQRHALAGLVRTFQTIRSYEDFTLVESILIAAQEHQDIGWWSAFATTARVREVERTNRARAAELLEMIGLSPYADAPVAVLSYGQRKLLSIVCAMASGPRLVVLDEPVSGINPTMIHRVEDAIREFNARGTTILVVEHNMDFIMRLCKKVIVLVGGKLLVEGSPAAVQSDQRVLEAYLGDDAERVPA